MLALCKPGANHAARVAPLVAVFVLASKTTDAFQMAKWSSRNVIPAKIALGLVFALLGVLVLSGARLPHLGPEIWYNLRG